MMNTIKKTLSVLGIVIFIILAIYIFQKRSKPPTKKTDLTITTSFYPLYFFASEIGGDKALIKNITPAGAEPHDYEPTTQDMVQIEKSNILILNGGHLEAWGDKIKNELKGTQTRVITPAEDLINQQIEEDGHTIQDPHVWLSPPLAKKEISKILSAFTEADPKNASYYQINAQNLELKLDELDRNFKEGLANCTQKKIVTSHAAFGYLATTYGFSQVSIAGLSPDEEPSIQKLTEITQFAKQHSVRYIFFESLVSPKLSETIAHEIGAQTIVLDPIEGVTDEQIKKGKNYLTIMNDNLKNLRIAQGCK